MTTAAPGTGTFIRVSVVGGRRRVALAVAADEVVADLVPRLRELLDEPAVSAPLELVGGDGSALRPGAALGHQVDHGAELRLMPATEVPAPAEVADVTDVLADTLAGRRLQSVRVSTIGFVIAVALLAGGAVRLAVRVSIASAHPFVAVVVVGLVLGLAVGTTLAGGRRRTGRGLAGAAVGGAAALALAAVEAVASVGSYGTGAAAVVGCTALLAVAVLPRLALGASGLTAIDDEVISGAPRPRGAVLHRADRAYRLLTGTTVAITLPLTAAIAVLVRSADPWATGLGAALLLGTALRARAMPLPSQQVPLALSTVVGLLFAVSGPALVDPPFDPVLSLGVLLVAVATIIAAPTGGPARRAARLRRCADRAEAVVLVAVLPLALGAFGVYADLLGAFR